MADDSKGSIEDMSAADHERAGVMWSALLMECERAIEHLRSASSLDELVHFNEDLNAVVGCYKVANMKVRYHRQMSVTAQREENSA